MSNTKLILRLVGRITANAVAYERLLQKKLDLECVSGELRNKLITQSAAADSMKRAIASHQKGVDKLKEKNDKLNADIKSAVGLLRILHNTATDAEDKEAIRNVCEGIGWSIPEEISCDGQEELF